VAGATTWVARVENRVAAFATEFSARYSEFSVAMAIQVGNLNILIFLLSYTLKTKKPPCYYMKAFQK